MTDHDDKFPQITLDDPPVTFDEVVGWIRNALAGVGAVACLIAAAFLWGYLK